MRTELAPDHPLQDALPALPAAAHVTRIDLPPLSADAVRQLAVEVLPQAPAPALVADVVRRSGGNPRMRGRLGTSLTVLEVGDPPR